MRKLYPALAACALIAAPASAQLVGGGLVVVNISDNEILNDIANDLDIDVSQVPVTVQVPVAVAAAVCGIDVNVLARQETTGNRNCDAETTNAAFNRFVQKQMRKNNK